MSLLLFNDRGARKGQHVAVEIKACREIMWRASENKWFEYSAGSRLMYFRFPDRYRAQALEGVRVCFNEPGPTVWSSQPPPLGPEAKEVLRSKISKLLNKRYLVPAEGACKCLKAVHKRSDAFHIFLIPRLFTPRWSRLFHKLSDFVFHLPPGSSYWPCEMHEPLFVGISLPLTHRPPWSLRRTPWLVGLEREMRRVQTTGETDGRDILCKLLRTPSRLASVSEDVARKLLQMPR